MKRYFYCLFESGSIDVETFQKAMENIPLLIVAHCYVFAKGFCDGAYERVMVKSFDRGKVYVYFDRDTFTDRSGNFSWKEFNGVTQKMKEYLERFGFHLFSSKGSVWEKLGGLPRWVNEYVIGFSCRGEYHIDGRPGWSDDDSDEE